MSVNAGPKIELDSLTLNIDPADASTIPLATQLVPDSEFLSTTRSFANASAYTSVYHVGEYKLGTISDGILTISGGDAANYYGEAWQTINTGDIGTTGGNWRYYNILPGTTDSTKDYIIECRWRFKYISKTGLGTTNPYMQLGNGYSKFFSKYFSSAGYDWQNTRVFIKGSQFTRGEFVFAVSSADSAVEIEYLRCYQTGQFAGGTTMNFSNTNNAGSFVFDGVDDYIGIPDPVLPQYGWSIEIIVKADSFANSPIFLCPVSNGVDQYFQYNSSGVFSVALASAADLDSRGHGTTHTATIGQYNHYVVTRDASTVKIYVNGVLDKNATDTTASAAWSSTWILGARGNATYFLDGDVALLRAYSKVLSGNEVRQNFNALRGRYGI